MTNILVAGLIGAAIAIIGAAFYHYYMYQLGRRADIALDVVSWVDDIYDRLITIHAQRDATFTGKPFGLSNEEYRQVVKEAKTMLLATRMHAKVALVYGESPQLDKFDTLKEEFVSIAELLLEADKDTWEEANKQINYKLSKIIDPLISATERNFLLASKGEAVAGDFMKRNIPTLYLAGREEKGVMVPAGRPRQSGGIARLAAEEAARFIEALLVLARLLVIVSVIGFAAWYLYGKPDLMKAYHNIVNPPAQAAAEPGFSQYLPSPDDYGRAWQDDGDNQFSEIHK